ncbi:MAG: hypothetical protein ACT4NY_15795 [Pseudonocardiales bacterium]
MIGGARPDRPDPGCQAFDEVVTAYTGPEFVERPSLQQRIHEFLGAESGQYLLITGEPGAGKTSLLAGMARDHRDWLRYFVRRDSRTVLAGGDVQSFLLSIGYQLARSRPDLFQPERLEVVVRQRVESLQPGGRVTGIRIDDLVVSPFYREAVLRLDQEVTDVAGSLVGVDIRRAQIEPRLLEPTNLTYLALIDPATALLAADPTATIVIAIDAVDEVLGNTESVNLIDWLSRCPLLPANVRLIVTSRPNPGLGLLRSARAGQLTEIHIDPRSREVTDDLLRFSWCALGGLADTALDRDGDPPPDEFVRQAARHAAGNFLYLATYARALTDAVEKNDHDLISQMVRFRDVPAGLVGLYTFFMDNIWTDITRLGLLETRDPTSVEGSRALAWEGVGEPILGILTVAEDTLNLHQVIRLGGIRVWPRTVTGILSRFRWLLDIRDDRMRFFHSSIGEFLASDLAQREHPEWAVAEDEWHERIVHAYRGDAATWAEIEWDNVDHYGLVHLAEHLTRCRPGVAATVADLPSRGLRAASRQSFGTDRHFLRLLEIATEHVIGKLPFAQALPAMLFLAVTRRQVLRSSHSLPPAALGLLARRGRTAEALEHVHALRPSWQQFDAVLEILKHIPEGEADSPRRRELVELLVEISLTVPPPSEAISPPRQQAARQAAVQLAPYDLDRALRLWDRAPALRIWDDTSCPDAVYQAAANATSARTAIGIVARMRAERASAYLDLADRSSSEGEAPELWRLAEECLDATAPAQRLVCRARLAIAWRTLDPRRAQHHREVILDKALPTAKEQVQEIVPGWVQAAAVLAGKDNAAAAELLGRLDAIEIDGRIDNCMLEAAELWLKLGYSAQTSALLDRVLCWSNTNLISLQVAAVLDRFDPPAAARLVDQVEERIQPADPAGGVMSTMRHDGDLQSLVDHLLERDPDRAETAARRIISTTWSDFHEAKQHWPHRYTALVDVAHSYLAHGRVQDADRLLTEVLQRAQAPVSLDDEKPNPIFQSTQAPSALSRPDDWKDVSIPYWFNIQQDWNVACRLTLFQQPADALRAMLPTPGSLGNPYSWARSLRTFAEEIARQEPDTALDLVRAISDPAERVVGVAAVLADAVHRNDTAREQSLWTEFTTSLNQITPYRWIADPGDDSQFAYLRPDHRARFEAAVRIVPLNADYGLAMLRSRNLSFLEYVFLLGFQGWASDSHTVRVARGMPPVPVYQHVHDRSVQSQPAQDVFSNVLLAHVLANETLICALQRRTPPRRAAGAVPDPLYAALAQVKSMADGLPTSQEWLAVIRNALNTPELPAAAAVITFAIKIGRLPEDVAKHLCDEVIAAARNNSSLNPDLHGLALLQLISAPSVASLVDVPALVEEVFQLRSRCEGHLGDAPLLKQLFPALVTHRPVDALRLLSDAVDAWREAAALLEYAAPVLVQSGGAGVPGELHRAIVRAMECSIPDGAKLPDVVDGVYWTGPSANLIPKSGF